MRWCFIAGDERDNGVGPLLKWMQFLRVKKCPTVSCPFYCNTQTVSPNNADAEWRDMSNIFTSDLASMLSNFSGNNIVVSHQESRCPGCKSTCQVSYHFYPQKPDVFVCNLLVGNHTLESNLQPTYYIGSTKYALFAYSLFHPASNNSGTSHYTIVFYDEGRRLVYDDRMDHLVSYNKRKLSGNSVVTLWLIKSSE